MGAITAIVGGNEAGVLTVNALHAMQHRGQEAVGLCVLSDDDTKRPFRLVRRGLVSRLFEKVPQATQMPEDLRGVEKRPNDSRREKIPKSGIALGHLHSRSELAIDGYASIEPLVARFDGLSISVVHNGNITNAMTLRAELSRRIGTLFSGINDIEILLHLIATSRLESWDERVIEALTLIEGGFAIAILIGETLYISSDSGGNRPIVHGLLDGETHVFASETCALNRLGIKASPIYEGHSEYVEPGEVLKITLDGKVRTIGNLSSAPQMRCLFEFAYFAMPDSILWGTLVSDVRRRHGALLARLFPVKQDSEHRTIVVPVPDSGNQSALGFFEATDGARLEHTAITRNHYAGRWMSGVLSATQKTRSKYNIVSSVVKDARVVILDDSVMRGETLKDLIAMIRRAGAFEVHVRVASPEFKYPCHYGMDTPKAEELISSRLRAEELCDWVGADSLHFLPLADFINAIGADVTGYCAACFTGKYPVRLVDLEAELL